MKFQFALVLLSLFAVNAEKVRYDNFQVYRVTPNTEAQLIALRSLENAGYSFWTDVTKVGKPVDIMVPPHLKGNFKDGMKLLNIQHEVFMLNVQEIIDQQEARSKIGNKASFFEEYHSLDEIYEYLKQMQSEHPDQVTVIVGGETYEGRDILGVHVSFKPENENRAVIFEGGAHAREWIAPATCLFILTEILKSSDPAVRDMAETYDWYIFPSVNPDGYVHSYDNDRLWRKTRKRYDAERTCYGTDPNRNWGFHWFEGGSSSDTCSETFAGTEAFSDIETKSLSEFITSINTKVIAYFSFHSYSQYLLLPYSYTDEHLDNYEDLYLVGRKAAAKLKERYGTYYYVGNIVETMYVSSGASLDWVKGTHGIPITYGYELRDQGQYGFLLPADQIIPTGEETLDSIVTIMKEFQTRLR